MRGEGDNRGVEDAQGKAGNSGPAAVFQPLSRFDAAGIHGVLTDIDDTLTRAGRLPPAVYAAIDRLVAVGVAVVPVTGRSAGWAHLIVHHWPVDAVIAESGGVCLHRVADRLEWIFHDDREQIARDRARLAACAERVICAFPRLRIADDNAFRLVDYAIDHAESVQPPADPKDVADAISMLRAEGFQARASSVHINAWSGDFDKAPMALQFLETVLGLSSTQMASQWCFIGDAPNDESMFAAFPRSVGVANLAPVADRLVHRPRWLTQGSHGDGFIELADRLVAARIAAGPGASTIAAGSAGTAAGR